MTFFFNFMLEFVLCVSVVTNADKIALSIQQRDALNDSLSHHKATFTNINTGSYEFEYQRLTLTIECYRSYFVIEVEQNIATTARFSVGDDYALEHLCHSNDIMQATLINRRITVNQMFTEIEECIRTCDSIEVTYHPILGYPLSYKIDRNLNLADVGDDVTVNINCLTFRSQNASTAAVYINDTYNCARVVDTPAPTAKPSRTQYCPPNCVSYFDGCNTCDCVGTAGMNEVISCTVTECGLETTGQPQCIECSVESAMVPSNCASKCPPSCYFPVNLCSATCRPGCACPDDKPYFEKGVCVSRLACPGFTGDCPKHCVKWTPDGCNECDCVNGKIKDCTTHGRCPNTGTRSKCRLEQFPEVECCSACNKACHVQDPLCNLRCVDQCECPRDLI